METKPKVTIITGYYNRQDYVRDSIESLIEQSYRNVEIIAFDDCSTDKTFELLKEYESLDSRVTVIRNEINKGFVNTLIEVINSVESEFIAIHGSGDISLKERISVELNYLLQNPSVGVVGCKAIREGEKYVEHDQGIINHFKINTEDLIIKNRIAHGSVMFRKRFYDQVGGYRSFFTFGQDRDLWLRMSLITDIVLLSRVLYIFTKIESSDTVSRNPNKLIMQIMLSSYSIQLVKMRVSYGYDLIDKYGDKAGLFYNPKSSTNKINKLILLQFYQNKAQNVKFLTNISKTVNPAFINRAFLAITNACYKSSFFRKLVTNVLKRRLKGKRVSDYKEVV